MIAYEILQAAVTAELQIHLECHLGIVDMTIAIQRLSHAYNAFASSFGVQCIMTRQFPRGLLLLMSYIAIEFASI